MKINYQQQLIGIGLSVIAFLFVFSPSTVINWVKSVGGKLLPEVYEPEIILQVGELDESESFKNHLFPTHS
ncbi:MAG: hypothetical protein VKJ02_05830 [Snowella sp.]|nr:hypothetical protein [Snowella sp.]